MVNYLQFFENLSVENHKPTSPRTRVYNCIAWAAKDEERWWQPSVPDLGYYWPTSAPQNMEVGSLIKAFESIGYTTCADGEPSSGIVKVAIYANDGGQWTHAARQLESGSWTSKLGKLEDIEHVSAEAISGAAYGGVFCFMGKAA